MIAKKIKILIKSDGSYLDTILPPITANEDGRTIVQVIAPFPITDIVSVNYSIRPIQATVKGSYLVPTGKFGKDVLADDYTHFQTVADWNVFEIPINAVALEYISKYRAGLVLVSFAITQLQTPYFATNYLGLFSNTQPIPATSYNDGDYFIANEYNFTAHDITWAKGDYAYFYNGKWNKGKSVLKASTPSIELPVDPSLKDAPQLEYDEDVALLLANDLGLLTQRVSQSETDIESAENDINEINGRVGVNETDIYNLERAVDDLDSRVDTILTTPVESVSAEEIIDARQGEVTLGANITKVKSQLAQLDTNKAEKNEVQSSLNLKRDKSSLIGVNDLDGETLGYLQNGTGGATINIESVPKDYSVNEKKTTFINVSTNLLDLSNLVEGKIDYLTGNIASENNYNVTDYIEFEENKNYIYSGGNSLSFHNENKDFISGRQYVYFSNNTFTTPEDTKFVRFSVSKSRLHNAQCNEGDTILPYEPYYPPTIPKTLKIEELTDIYNRIDNVDSKVKYIDNIYKGDFVTGVIISPNTDVNYIYKGTNTEAQLAYIPVEKGKKYTIKATGDFINFNLAFSNGLTENTPIERLVTVQMNMTERVGTVENVNGYEYLLIYATDSNAILADIEIYEGDSVPENTPAIKINDVELVKKSEIPSIRLDRYSTYFESNDISSYQPSTYDEIYSWYDELVANSNGYVTKIHLGDDAQGNPMYTYNFTMGDFVNDFGIEKKRVGILSGLHGDEKGAVVGLYNFMKELTYNDSNNEIIDRIKSVMNFYIIPVGNPTGFNAYTRHNWNDVNLNRNFDINWETTDGNKGVSPASENETQIIQQWMVNNQFNHFIDYHRSDMSGDDYASWIATHEDEGSLQIRKEYYRAIALLSSLWSERFEEFPKNIIFGRATNYTFVAQSWLYSHNLGADSCLLEMSETWRYFQTDVEKLRHRHTWGADLIGNYIFEIAKRYI